MYYDKSMPTNGTHHWLPSAFCAMFWDMIDSKPDSGMCYTRGGGIGAQRAPYMWAGDQARGYKSLEYQLTSVLSSGISGVPFMSYDMSGYQYGNESRDIAHESQVFIRGTQFSAFTICLQTHGKVKRSYQFAKEYPVLDAAGIEKKDANGNVIMKDYSYVTDIYRAYVKLHELLTPYITEHAAIASSTGMPLMRHMVLHWQDDSNVYTIDDQYMFGDAFLVAPVLNDMTSRDVYLPEGKWQDMNTGEIITVGKDGQWLKGYAASVGTLPLFYNMDTTSQTAEGLLDGIREIFDYVKTIEP
jgi:alpha-D-xyloside xylohydrolase